MLPHAASSSSDQIGLGHLAVDTTFLEGFMSINFIANTLLRVFVLIATQWYSVCRTKVNSDAIVRWHDTARALKGDPQACSHHYAIQNENKPGFLSNCQYVSFFALSRSLVTVLTNTIENGMEGKGFWTLISKRRPLSLGLREWAETCVTKEWAKVSLHCYWRAGRLILDEQIFCHFT